MRRFTLLATLCTLALTSGCRDLDRFDTGNDEAYCGSIVSTVGRDWFPADLRLRATIDTDNLTTAPGTLSTDDSELCAPSPLLHAAPMRTTDAIFSDPLSTLDFGTGRDHNFLAWVDSSCKGPMMAVVSLMRNDDVEVRLMKPERAPSEPDAPSEPSGFGVFQLQRYKGDCGF